MSDDGAQIIVFPTIPGGDAIGPPADVKEKNPSFSVDKCTHRKTTLDLTAHRMYCSDCEQELDCFDWIVDYSRKWRRFNTEYRQAIKQADEARQRVDDLERVEKNAKARIRKQGVILTSGQARRIRDNYRAFGRALNDAYRDRLQTEDDRHKLRVELKLMGVDFEEAPKAFRVLDDQLELRHTEAPITPALPGS